MGVQYRGLVVVLQIVVVCSRHPIFVGRRFQLVFVNNQTGFPHVVVVAQANSYRRVFWEFQRVTLFYIQATATYAQTQKYHARLKYLHLLEK